MKPTNPTEILVRMLVTHTHRAMKELNLGTFGGMGVTFFTIAQGFEIPKADVYAILGALELWLERHPDPNGIAAILRLMADTIDKEGASVIH